MTDKDRKPNQTPSTHSGTHKKFSVTEYAYAMKLTRQAILWQCANSKLADGATAEKVGNTWVITAPGHI